MIDGIDLDHVALAAERHRDLWPRYAGDLGGQFKGGGVAFGFAPAQMAFANGMRLEILRPYEVERNDFLRRFLDRSGPGPHHITFKVKDIEAALREVEAAGFHPIGVDLRDWRWKESFIHPKEAHGIVVQIAQAAGDFEGDAGHADLPPPRTQTPASFDRIVHGVPSIDDARPLFVDLLAGAVRETGEGWVELAWPGPGRIRLVERPGPPRLQHLEFTCERPEELTGARDAGDGTWVVEPEDNLGTRLVLHPLG